MLFWTAHKDCNLILKHNGMTFTKNSQFFSEPVDSVHFEELQISSTCSQHFSIVCIPDRHIHITPCYPINLKSQFNITLPHTLKINQIIKQKNISLKWRRKLHLYLSAKLHVIMPQQIAFIVHLVHVLVSTWWSSERPQAKHFTVAT